MPRIPAATLSLVGRRPPEWLRAKVANTPGVRVFADVPDVRPFLATAGMLVVPLRIGGGSRLKILEALATETPVVSTRVGAEGLQLTPDRDLIVTETPDGLVERDHRRRFGGRTKLQETRRERSATRCWRDTRGIRLRTGSMKSGNPWRVVPLRIAA